MVLEPTIFFISEKELQWFTFTCKNMIMRGMPSDLGGGGELAGSSFPMINY